MVKARKGNLTTIFSDMVWKNMGANRNGWVIDTEGHNQDLGSAVDKVVGTLNEIKYGQLMAQAKGFATDGKHAEALAKYEEAYALKPSPSLKGLITKMSKAGGDDELSDIVKSGDQAFAQQDYVTALEFYNSVAANELTDAITAKIAEANRLLAED